MFSKIPPGLVTVTTMPKKSPKTKAMIPDHPTITRVSPMALKKSGSRAITLGINFSSRFSIFDHLHADVFLPQIGKSCIDLSALSADNGYRSADGRILYDLHISKDDV